MFVLDSIKEYAMTDRIAVIGRDERLGFSELDARSDAFAHWLLERFGDSRAPVLIYGHKEMDFLPCLFGALKSGRAYVPVDSSVPPGRAAEIAADVCPGVIIDFSGVLPPCDTCLVIPGGEALRRILLAPVKTQIPRDNWVSGEDTAYILFTSGSTGGPKGVPITAANLGCFQGGLLPFLEDEGGVILNQVSYAFDVSCCSVYTGLSRGMTLFTADREMVENLGVLFDYLRKSGLNEWVSTPSFAELCARADSFSSGLLPSLNKFLFCGEVLTHKLCDLLAERFPAAQILNTYGPTEATVLVTAVRVTEEMRRDRRSIPIGRPIDNIELRLVTDGGQEINSDEEYGELLILGDSVGTGYYRRPDLTKSRFFTDKASGKRGYRTGDICCRKDGLYYYHGRTDSQIKLGGFRIELEDIENNLARVENISRAAVLPMWEDGRVTSLAAFILLEKDDGLSPFKRALSIKKRAADFLPAYMIPGRVIAVDAFPLTTSGKIDRKELAGKLREGTI